MSDQLDQLMARGAQCSAGDIILRNVSMGRLKNGVFAITPEGEAELGVLEVEAVEVAPKATKSRKKKDEVVEAPAPADDLDLSDLGDLGE